MKHAMRVLASVTLLAISSNAFAQRCPPNCQAISEAVPVGRSYDLRVLSIQPTAALVEHQDIVVEFQLVVSKFGIVGQLKPQAGQVCGANHRGTCVSFASLDPGRTYRGRLTTLAPAASRNADIAILLEAPQQCKPGIECFGTELLAEGHAPRPVAAEYVISIDSFTIRHTRAIHEDTPEINLSAKVPGQRSSEDHACDIVGPPTYCVSRAKQGNHNDGTFAARGASVGLYRLIPDVEPELALEYHIINLGTPYEQRVAQKIFDGISDAAGAFMSAYSGNSGWGQVNDFTHKLNALQFSGCDGPVFVGAGVLRNQTLPGGENATLDALTRATGRYRKTQHAEDFDEITSQDGCGRSPRYDVTYSVVRTSWQPWP